jgi:hypothetical protein
MQNGRISHHDTRAYVGYLVSPRPQLDGLQLGGAEVATSSDGLGISSCPTRLEGGPPSAHILWPWIPRDRHIEN